MCCNWVGNITIFLKCHNLNECYIIHWKITFIIRIKHHMRLNSLVHPATSKTKAKFMFGLNQNIPVETDVRVSKKGMESRNFPRIYIIFIYIIYMHVYIKIWKSHALKSTRTQPTSLNCIFNGSEHCNKKPNSNMVLKFGWKIKLCFATLFALHEEAGQSFTKTDLRDWSVLLLNQHQLGIQENWLISYKGLVPILSHIVLQLVNSINKSCTKSGITLQLRAAKEGVE